MSKNDRNIDFFEIWQKTSKKPQKNIKNLEKIAEKILANNTPFDSLNCACVQKKHQFFAFSQPKLIYWGIFEKNRDFDQKKNAPFSPKSATHNIISEKRLPKLYLRILSSTYMQSLKKFYTAVFENLNNFFIFLIRYFF